MPSRISNLVSRISFNNLKDGFEGGVFGVAAQFKEKHFCAGQFDAFVFQSAQCQHFVGRVARRDRIRDDVHFMTRC